MAKVRKRCEKCSRWKPDNEHTHDDFIGRCDLIDRDQYGIKIYYSRISGSGCTNFVLRNIIVLPRKSRRPSEVISETVVQTAVGVR